MKKLFVSTIILGLSVFALAQQGSQLYQQNCAQCHGNNGGGGIGPALAGDQKLQDPNYHITQILNGGGGMPAYAGQLSNKQIAAIATYERTSWGNSFSQIAAQQVAQVRQGQQAQSSSGGQMSGGSQSGGSQSGGSAQVNQPPKQPTTSVPTQQELDNAASSNDWLMYNKGYNSQRYSGLKQIDRQNAKNLRPVCAFQTGDASVSFQTSLIVYGGVMYFTTPENTYAINAETCAPVWNYSYTPTGPEPFPTNRGVAIAGGRVFRGTTDAHLLALDAKTGKLLWDTQPVNSQQGYFLSSAPIVWHNLVLTGTAGADWGAPAQMFAFDVKTGKQVWSFNEVVAKTFGKAEAASKGGGSNWTSYTLDQKTGMLYVPVGNPAPDFACGYRPGANLYTNSVIVLDAKSGKLVRWYQQIPHDCLDRDTAAPPVLFELNGVRHMVASSKNGLMYVYNDTTSGSQARQAKLPPQQGKPQQSEGDTLLYAVPATTRTNVTAKPTTKGTRVCPGINGGVEWYGPAFSPNSQTLFVSSVDWCSTFTLGEVRYTPGQLFFGGSFSLDPVAQSRGWLKAFDAANGKLRWSYQSQRPLVAGATPTEGGVIFTGELTNDFIALDGVTGKVLYRFNTGGPVGSGVSTYEVKGKQYVAVASGNTSRTWNPNTGAAATVFVFALSN